MRVCAWVYAHTHTRCIDGVLGCEPRGRDEIPGGPEESRWTKSQHICIRICVQGRHAQAAAGVHAPRGSGIVHMCIYMLRGGRRSWTNCFLFFMCCMFYVVCVCVCVMGLSCTMHVTNKVTQYNMYVLLANTTQKEKNSKQANSSKHRFFVFFQLAGACCYARIYDCG